MKMPNSKLKLYGFNNLTKTLSFNIYDICYTRTEEERKAYIEYIDEQYNAERLTHILTEVTHMIGASVLNIAKQDYDPQGASVTLLISEGTVDDLSLDPSCNRGVIIERPTKESVVAHLDKSHVTVHTYPEAHPENNISTFRVDIDVSTCGEISPIKALNYLINSFDSDIITIDYRVRGFTRDLDGTKHFIDHQINSIQDFIDEPTLHKYLTFDVNLHHTNIFHTKMMIDTFNIDNYLFNVTAKDLTQAEIDEIRGKLNHEMVEIYYGMNIPEMK
jgi:S-adenosylmethionine decarboxylase